MTSVGFGIKGQHDLLDLAKSSNWGEVKKTVAANPECINVQPSQRWSLLHHAAEQGAMSTLSFLLEHRADINLRNVEGQTPLDVAHMRCKDLLTDSGQKTVKISGQFREAVRRGRNLMDQDDFRYFCWNRYPHMQEQTIQTLFSLVDIHKKTVLELEDFLRFMQQESHYCKLATEKAAKNLYDSVDTDHDSFLNIHEFTTMMQEKLGTDMTRGQIETLFQHIVGNASGKVTFKQFLDFLDPTGSLPFELAQETGMTEFLRTWIGNDVAYEAAKREAMRTACAAFQFQGYIERSEHRAITSEQLNRVLAFASAHARHWHDTSPASATFKKITDVTFLNLYHVNEWLIMPATRDNNCSFVELLSATPQPPAWFISHWWGEYIRDFVVCVGRHSVLHHLGDKSPYWVCAYANRQHDLANELCDDPRKTSFYKALRLSRGLLLILDRQSKLCSSGPATPFTRIWCSFELMVALTDADDLQVTLHLEVATLGNAPKTWCGKLDVVHGDVHILSDGPTAEDLKAGEQWALCKQGDRQRSFPINILAGGLALELEKARATSELDRIHILNSVAGRDINERPPLSHHASYSNVNLRLRSMFAIASWPQAFLEGSVRELELPRRLAEDGLRTKLILSLATCSETFDDAGLSEFSQAINGTSLKRLQLSFFSCKLLTNLDVLSDSLARCRQLNFLSLNFRACDKLISLVSLTSAMAQLQHLSMLDLNFQNSGDLACNEAVYSLANGLRTMTSLDTLTLDLRECIMTTVDPLAEAVKGLSLLTNLELRCWRCSNLIDTQEFGPSLVHLATCGLKVVLLDFQRCQRLPKCLQQTLRSVAQARNAFKQAEDE